VRFGRRSFGSVRVSHGGTHACGSARVCVRGGGRLGVGGHKGGLGKKKKQSDAKTAHFASFYAVHGLFFL